MGPVLTDDQFKGLFEQKGAAAAAEMPLPGQQDQQLPDLPKPGPGKPHAPVKAPLPGGAVLSDEDFNKTFGRGTEVNEGNSGERQGYNPGEFNFQPKLGQDNEALRAQHQGWFEQTAKTVGNTLANIPIDVLQSIGYTGALLNDKNNYSNGLVDMTEGWKNPFGEVYREHPDQTFDLADPAWWLQNIGGLTEGVAQFAVPGEAEAAGIGVATKAIVGGLKLGAESANALLTTGHVLSGAHMAYLMAASSGRQVYNESYDTNYHRLLAQGLDPYTADSQAKDISSQAAATTVRTSTMLNTLLSMAAIAPLFRNNENRITQWLETAGARQEGESLEQWKGRLQQASSDPDLQEALKYRQGATSHSMEAAQMSLMGLNNEYAEKKGREVGTKNTADNVDALTDYFDKVTDKEGMLNILTGLVSGPGLAMVLDNVPLHRVVSYDDSGKPILKNDPNIVAKEGDKPQYVTQKVSARTRDAMGNQQFFDNLRDSVVKDVDWFSKKHGELAAARKTGDDAKAAWLKQELFSVNNLHAISTGLGDNWKKEYQDIGSLDNKKDLGEAMQPQIDQLQEQLKQATAQGQDPALVKQALDAATQRQQALRGKTDAMMKGFASSPTDNDYQKQAGKAVDNLSWMGDRYKSIRAQYVTPTDPRSEELAYHLFARESELHLMRQSLDEEKASIARDQSIVDPLTSYRQEMLVHQATADHLNKERDRLVKHVRNTDFDGLRTMMGEYGIPTYDDSELNKGIKKLHDRLSSQIADHNEQVEQARQSLEMGTGYDKWKTTNEGKTFDDYLRNLHEQSPIDSRIQERQENLEKMEDQYKSRKKGLDEVKSSRGISDFLNRAEVHHKEWKKEMEEKNLKDNVAAFMKQQDLTASERIRKVQAQQEAERIRGQVREHAEKENEVKARISALRNKIATLAGDRSGTFRKIGRAAQQMAAKVELRLAEARLASIQRDRAGLEHTLQINDSKIQSAAINETNAAQLTRDQVQNNTQPQPEEGTKPNPEVPPPPPPVVEQQPTAGKEDKPIEDYVGLKDSLHPFPELQNALDNLETIQDPHNYSYDMAEQSLFPYILDGTIPDEFAHNLIVKQKAYLEHQAAESFNASIPQQSLASTVLPEELNPPVEPITEDDITGPGEPFTPIMNFASMATPEESLSIDTHLGAKPSDALKINVAAIQYMEVTKQRGNQTVHLFLPMYDKLDPTFNKNILKPNFIAQGDELSFHVDTNWRGKINYDRSLAQDDFGDQIKKADEFGNYTESGGKIRMGEDPNGYANVPIKIVHTRSGETVGYLPRTDWVTASYGGGYRNIVDTVTEEDGSQRTGNVEAQKQKLLTVRRIISLAHNEGAEPIRSTVSPRDSPGHPFYSTDVNRNTETSKLHQLLAKNLLPDPKLNFGILNGGTVFTGHNSPLQGPKNFTPRDLAAYGKGKEANNMPMVILPMPNGKHSVSPVYTRQLSERPADIHTIARVIEAHLTQASNDQHKKWADVISKATSQGGSKPLDITNANDLESFINQYYTHTRHFRATDTAFDAKAAPGTQRKAQFMLDIEGQGKIKVGNSFSGQKPVYASLTPEGKLDPAFEQALTEGLSTHWKNVVYTRGDIKGINDDRPLHAVTIKRDGNVRTDKFDNYNDYLKSFAETMVYGKHQAEDGTYLYGANPVVNFDFNQIANTRIGGAASEEEGASRLTPEEDNIFGEMMNAQPTPGGGTEFPLMPNAMPTPTEPRVITLDNIAEAPIAQQLSTETIQANIGKLYEEAAANPGQEYRLDLPTDPKAKLRLGDKSTITMTRLASMLDAPGGIPYNVKLSDDFMAVLQNTPKRFLNGLLFDDRSMFNPLPVDEDVLGKQIKEMFVPMRDEAGNATGVFDAERQVEVTDNVVQAIKMLMDSGKAKDLSVEGYKDRIKNDVFKMMRDKYERVGNGETIRGMEKVTAESAKALTVEYDRVLRSFDTEGLNFWSLAMNKLKALGINVRDSGRDRSFDQSPLRTADGTDPLEETHFKQEEGHGLKDWSDSSFYTDPKDTASARMKMFLATTPDSKVGDEEQPKEVKLSFTDPALRQRIINGQKQFTVRTPDQVQALGLKPGEDATTKVDGKLMRVTPIRRMDANDVVVHQKVSDEEGIQAQPGDTLLKLEPYSPRENVLTTNRNYLGLAKLADYEQLFESTLSKLAGQERSIDNYISILRNEGNRFNPNLRALAERLDNAPTEVKNEFVSVMSLQYQPFSMVLLDNRKDQAGRGYNVLRTIDANRGSQLNVIMENWQQNQKFSPILTKNSSGITVVDRAKADELKADLDNVNALYNKGDKGSAAAAEALLRKTLEYNGVTMSQRAIQSLVDDTARWTKKTSVTGDFRRQFAISQDGKPLGIISSMIQKLAGASSENDDLEEMEDKSYMLTNPLYTEKTSMNVLARVAAAHTSQLYSNTHLSSEGKNIYDYGFNSSLSNAVRRIKSEDEFRGKFNDVDIAKKSWLLGHLNANAELRERFALTYLDGLKVAYMPGAAGVVRPEMSDREQLLTALGLFQNQGDPRYAHYLSLTHSDKSTTPVFRNAPRVRDVTVAKMANDSLTGGPKAVLQISEEAMNHMHNLFHSEYDRITRAAQVGDYNNPKYEQGAKYFYFMPEFNHADMTKAVKEGRVPQKVMDKIYVQGTDQLNVKEAPGFKEAVQFLLASRVRDMTDNTLDEWKKNEIVTDGDTPFDRKYMNRLLGGVGIRSEKMREERTAVGISNYFDRNNQMLDIKTVHNTVAQLAARDYAVNSFLMNTSMSQIFYGDPAQTWKGSVDKTMVEYGKRLAKDIAPGRELAFPQGATYTSVTAKDFKTNAPYLSQIESLRKAYADGHPLESTDAQELTTVQEHIDVLHAAGRITDKVYNDMSKIIKDANGKYYEFTVPLHKAVVMQPQKPVYAGDRAPVGGALLNDYIKSSSYPLYPPFTAGKELDSLRTAMETSSVARLNFESAHKIGVPSNPVDIFDEQGKVRQGVFDSSDWTGKDKSGQPVASARQDLSRDNFRIQQEVPYDEDKESIRTVSQMNKLITEGIQQVKTLFDYNGKQISGAELRQAKEDIRKQLFDINQQALLKDIGAHIDGAGKVVIPDTTKLFDRLQSMALEGNLGLTANDLAYLQQTNRLSDGQLAIPLMYAPSAQKFESMLMSMVGDMSNIKMPGKSYIQASPVGHQQIKAWEDLSEKEKKNIIHVGDYQGEALKTARIEDGVVKPAQFILPFNFQVRGKPVDMEQFVKTDENGRRTIDPDRIPPALLQLIGARIPNQGLNLPGEIVGFVPANMGDLAIVPAAITKQMGSDFDVDKLYTYRRAYERVPRPETSSKEPQHRNMEVDPAFNMWDTGTRNGTKETPEAAAEVDRQIIAGQKVGGGESIHDVEDRVIPRMRELIRTAPDGTVVVTHSSTIKLIEQWDAEGRKDTNQVDAKAYTERHTAIGDEIPLKSDHGTIWIVRHGETTDNAAGNFRSPNAELTSKGEQQAIDSGKMLQSKIDGPIPKMYTSEMDRTKHSGNLINETMSPSEHPLAFQVAKDESDKETQLKNDYFNVHWSILTHPDLLAKMLNPLDKNDLKEEGADISKWEAKQQTNKPSYYDSVYQLRDFQAQKDAKRLVGLSSLSTTFNAVIQDKDIRPGIITMGEDFKPEEKAIPIHIVDEDGHKRTLSSLSGYGQSIYKRDGESAGQPRSKHDNHTTVQSEVLDYAKNKISDKVHLSTYTYPASAALTQLQEPDSQKGSKLIGEGHGWAANLKYNARLLSQPIVQEYVAEMSKRGDSLSGEYTPDLKQAVVDSLTKAYTGLSEGEPPLPPDHVVSYQDLTDALKNPDKLESYGQKQIAALQLFHQLDQIGTAMMAAQSTINHDTNGAGASLLDTLSKDNTREGVLNPINEDKIGLLGTQDLYTNAEDKTEQGDLYDKMHQTAYGVVGKFFPYRDMMPIFKYVMEQTNRQDLSVDAQKNVFNGMKSFLFSHPDLGLWDNPQTSRAGLLYHLGDNASLAERVNEAKNTWGSNNYFLQRLQTDIDPDGVKPSYVSYIASKASRLDDYENTKAWLDMFLSPDKTQQKVAEDLVRYAYLTGGIQDARSFVKYMPYSYLIGTNFGGKLRELTSNLQGNVVDSNFKQQWFQHNPQFAKSLSGDMKELGSEVEKYPERFTLQKIDLERDPLKDENPARNLAVKVMDTNMNMRILQYPDFLSYRSKEENRWILYKQMEDRQSYTRIDTLGDKGMDEYSADAGLQTRSLIPENRSKAYNNLEPIPRMLNGSPLMARPEQVAREFSMPLKGGYEDIRGVLTKFATDPEVPKDQQIVSEFLSYLDLKGPNHDALTRVWKDSAAMPSFKFELLPKEKIPLPGSAGMYDTANQHMYIGDDPQSAGQLAATVNHEMIHAHTALLTSISESDQYLEARGYNKGQIANLRNLYEEVKRNNPEVDIAIRNLNEVRDRAVAQLRDYMEKAGYHYDTEYNRVIRQGQVRTNLDRLIYAVSSNTEFATMGTTDLPVMRWLDTRKYDGKEPKSFLSHINDFVTRIMSALAHSFGYPPERGSMLEAAMHRTLDLMTVGKTAPEITPSSLSDIRNMDLINAAPIASAPINGLDRVIGKLEEQRDEIVHSLTGRLSSEDIADKRAKLDDIEADIARLNKELDTNLVAQIGQKHLGWVESVTRAENPTSSQIMTASRVLEVWTNLVDLLYGEGTDKVDPTFADLYGNARNLRTNLTGKMKETLVNTSDNVIGMRDFNTTQLKDVPKGQALTRGLSSAAESKVTQYIATNMETVARHRDEDTVRLVHHMRDLEGDMAVAAGGKKNLPDFYDQFFQSNKEGTAWGFVQRFHQDWYDFRKSTISKRVAALKEADSTSESPQEASGKKKDIWQRYWKTMNENASFADTRLLFDPETGARKDDATAIKHQGELEKELGKPTADELIGDAQEKYRRYLDVKKARFTAIDGEQDAGEMTEQEANRHKDEFVSRYSPNVFFNNFRNPLSHFKDINSDYYVKMAPKRSVNDGHFYDKKFDAIQEDPRKKAIYDKINDTMEELKSGLPIHVQQNMGANFMPAVAKSLFTDVLDVPAYIKTMGRKMIDDLTASVNEEMKNNNSYDRLPLRYISDDRKNLPLEMRSKDIPRIMEAFGMMALHYKHFSDAKDYIDMGEATLREIDRARSAGASQMEQNGKLVTVKDGLRNTLDALKYMKDYMLFKKSRSLEGRSETILYSPNPITQFKTAHEVKNLVAEREELMRKIIDGDIDPAEAQPRMTAINEVLNDPRYQGRRLYGSKVGDKLIGINQLKTLSYNPFSGIANMAFGVVSAAIHANGGADFSWRHLGQAYKMMGHSILKWASAGAKETETAGKVLAIMDRLGIIGDVIDSHYGKIENRERKPGWQRVVNPYNWMRSGDYYMKGLTTVAMMLHEKVNVTEGGEGKQVSLWDALDNNGQWNKERFGENKGWQSEDLGEQKDLDKFRNKAIRVNMMIHGNQDKNSPKLANKYILGRLMGQFRMSWLPEGWYSRFQGEKEDIQLGRTTKGRYATIKDLGFMGYAAVTLKQLKSIVAKVDPYTGTSRLDGKALTEVDKENMRRNFAELGFIAGMAGTLIVLKSTISPDDDDATRWSLRMLANQLIRNQQDLEFYASPGVFDAVTRNVIPASDVLKDYWKAMKATARVMTDDNYEADKWIMAITHAGLPIPQATLANKFRTAATRDLDAIQQ